MSNGWQIHPANPGYYYKGQEVIPVAQLSARLKAEEEQIIQARVAQLVDAALDRERKVRLEAEAAENDDARCQEEFEWSEHDVPGFPTEEQLAHYRFVLSNPIWLKRYRIPAVMLTDEARQKWNLPH